LDSPLTETGTMLGTPAYMAPEQLAGEPADARADQYAFCATAWEALAGERPFTGETIAELAAAQTAGTARSDDRVPRRLRAVRARGLAHAPADRFGSMAELLDALGRAWRRPRRIAIGCGALALAAGGLVIARVAMGPTTWLPTVINLPVFE